MIKRRSFLKLLVGLPALTLTGSKSIEKAGELNSEPTSCLECPTDIAELEAYSSSEYGTGDTLTLIINTLNSPDPSMYYNITRNNPLFKQLTKKSV